MLIGITGPICAGKHSTAEFLVQHHGFLRLHLPTPSQLQPPSPSPSPSPSSTSHGHKLCDSTLVASASENLARLLPSVTDQKGTRGLTFPDVDSLLDFVTRRWREHWVLTDIYDEATLEALLRRPFFLLLNVDAPVGVRYARFSDRCRARRLSPMPLADFIYYNDVQLYGSRATVLASGPGSGSATNVSKSNSNSTTTKTTSTLQSHPQPQPQPHTHTQSNDGLPQVNGHQPAYYASSPGTEAGIVTGTETGTGIAHLLARSHLQILNADPTIPSYYSFLATLDLASPARLRPTWDAYFMTLASLASQRSNCMKRRVGCVLVHNSRIISTGYNGTPRNLTNCNEGGCARCNSASSGGAALSTCLCLHAEENALLEAGRERIRDGTILYCDTCPCLTCSVKIAQVGVKEVVYTQGYNMDDASRRVLKEAGVELRQFSPPKSGLVGFPPPAPGRTETVHLGKQTLEAGHMLLLNGQK